MPPRAQARPGHRAQIPGRSDPPPRGGCPYAVTVFNVTGGEMIVIILAALVVLGPEKLPDVLRRAGRLYGELRRMSDGFQQELRNTLEEPTRELRETAEMAKASFTGLVDTAKGVVNPTATITTTEHVDAEPAAAVTEPEPAPAAEVEPVPGETDGAPTVTSAPRPFGEGQTWSAHPVEQPVAEPQPAEALAAPSPTPSPTLPPASALAAPLPPPGRVALAAPPVATAPPMPLPLPPPAAPLPPPSPAVATNGDHP